MLEKTVEAYLVERVRALGGNAYKFSSPAHTAVPDRIVVLPPGRIHFVELKRPGAKPTAAQRREHDRMRTLGADVRVLDSIAAINAFLREPIPAPVAVLPEVPTDDLLSIMGGYPWRLQGNVNKQDITARYAALRRALLADTPAEPSERLETTSEHTARDIREGHFPKQSEPQMVPAEPLKRCAAARDGDCSHAQCPQLRDNEPHSTGRSCPVADWGSHD